MLRRIGRYEVESCLGGGMALVYRAQDPVMGRVVAVKVLREANDGGDAKRRFLWEAQVAARMTHANVVRIYDFGEDEGGRPFMVMEYVPGQDLGKAIKNNATGDLKAKLLLSMEIASALQYIHSHGIVHRDIKPENICIADNGDVKLMDFGIAKLGSVSMTQAGYTLGTPPYMAPEQIRSEPVTSATDVYSFGLLLYELIAGVRAFQGDQFDQLFYKVLSEPIDIGPLRAQGANDELCEFIKRCAAKNPADRPQSFSDVRAALAVLIKSQPLPHLPESPTKIQPPTQGVLPAWKRIPRFSLYAAVLLIALLVTAAGMLLFRGKTATVLPANIETTTGQMVLVPAGPFLVGENNQQSTLPDFYIDRTEVTNSAYLGFCKATGRDLPPGFLTDKPDYPVVNVSYTDAESFANWAGKRLPSSLEWEKAARGIQGRRFPWGDAEDPARANVKNNPNAGKSLAPASGFQSSIGPFGTLNMIGNVWEYINESGRPSSQDLKNFKKYVPNLSASTRWILIRGGSFMENLDPTVGWNSAPVPTDLRNQVIGFRCVQDVTKQAQAR